MNERIILDKSGEVVGVTGERVSVKVPVDLEALRPQLQAAYDEGIRSIAVVLMHSYL